MNGFRSIFMSWILGGVSVLHSQRELQILQAWCTKMCLYDTHKLRWVRSLTGSGDLQIFA